MSTKRMTANPTKAPRYRPGKAVPEEDSSDSDASDGEEQEPSPQAPSKPLPKFTSAGGIASNPSNVSLDERRKRAAAVEAARLEEEKALRAKEEEGFVTEESDEEEGSEEGSGEESDEESESEEEAPRKVLLRPTFIKKDKRNAMGVSTVDNKPDEEKLAEEEARRQAAADEIVEEQIRKDLAAKAAGKKHWDDEESNASEVDDTDDIDPEAEHAAWKLRELKRIKRDREAIETREREIEELERRKNLSVEERQAEDDAHLALQKEEKDSKAKMSYLQKYHHKGAFFQDHARAEGLDSRNIMGARFADEVQNRELLPQALQMRDMTKLGRKGATKYRDLRTEDTGRWGQFDDRRPRDADGPFVGDDRFRPDAQGRGGAGVTGANSQPVAVGRRNPVLNTLERPRAARDGRDDTRGDGYRSREERGERRSKSRSPRREKRIRSRSRSRSRSPRRERRIRSRSRSRSRSPRREGRRDDRRHRKRSYSRERERERERDRHEDKRQRVDSR